MYDIKSSLTGIGNRSSVDNFDDTIFLVSFLYYAHLIATEASAYAIFSFALLCLIDIMNKFSLRPPNRWHDSSKDDSLFDLFRTRKSKR